MVIIPEINKEIRIPLFSSKVPAGFPSPAADHVEKRLDLNEYLIHQADATYFFRVSGDSMIDAHIFNGDMIVVDRSIEAKVGDIVLARLDDEFTVKILGRKRSGMPRLLPANDQYKPIEISESTAFEVIGVVTGCVRKFK